MTERWFDYPDIDPVAISLGPLQIHWYGIMYLIGFGAAWWLGKLRARKPYTPLQELQVADLIFWGALGVVLGGRLGYVFFYNFGKFLDDPLWLFEVWTGGMSFHGGLIGVIVAMWLYGRSLGLKFFQVADFVAPLVPIGLGMGRLGNFIGGELWGRPTDVPWAMVFPRDPLGLARHPSQLYQFALEGVALFCILWFFSRKPRPRMTVSGLFLLCYGIFRILVEFVREPDAHIGYLAWGWLTEGQLLSMPMVIVGLLFIGWGLKFHQVETSPPAAAVKVGKG
ncbi:prolipoprotein diacylglyceryl transferase [Hahella sp. CCB-MM4]|uniref:prolipoprotein diacylglyceryl transferase n=1 Tax=Hahella sp. (strain CCB-MM4) TaxID=1926491 RepID=UPI000B9C5848|nr:prolipoprotein diacylglyceryl transferase [Hahella sp. CCB-MM4]OZG71966.1 prolipoprotein diacylglyceryl transferase [Hahella sp. CCB-MM4]